MNASHNALSLFSGAGGDTYGLEAAGWTVTHFSEIKEIAINTHTAAFPSASLLTNPTNKSKDIKQIPDTVFSALKGKIDLIFAGFPCQGFSHAGKKKADDPRNELVHEFVRATRLIQPAWIMGENVKGLLSRNGSFPVNTAARPVISIIQDLFESIGYAISYTIVDATDVGVPQHRKRLLIVGHKGTLYPHVSWPTPAQDPLPSIRHILTSTLDGAVELPTLYAPNDQPARFWISTQETVPTGTPHPNLVRLVAGIRNLSSKEKLAQGVTVTTQFQEPAGLLSFGVRKSGYHGQIVDPDEPSKTIICAYNQCPRLFVGLQNAATRKFWARCLTPAECAAIQGFPTDFPWKGDAKEKYIQIGNAVPPPLATAIAKRLPTCTFSILPQNRPQEEETEEEEEDA